MTDYNKLLIVGFTDEILGLEPLVVKWESFWWEVFETDGHDWDDLNNKITAATKVSGKPAMVIAHTIKGKGCSEIENTVGSHNIKVPDAAAREKYLTAMSNNKVTLPY